MDMKTKNKISLLGWVQDAALYQSGSTNYLDTKQSSLQQN